MSGVLTLVSATRMTESEFWRQSYLGRSLRHWPEVFHPRVAITYENVGPSAIGLPALYNRALDRANDADILVFVHDDVFLHDVRFAELVTLGLDHLDVVGLAGSWGTPPADPAWGFAFAPDGLTPTGWIAQNDRQYVTGAVSHSIAHAGPPPVSLGVYGPCPRPADKLDGLLLAARARSLRQARVRFDEQFDWHLYDLDFSQQCHQAGLRLGTWPLLVTHASGGGYTSSDWNRAARTYRAKWSNTQPPEP